MLIIIAIIGYYYFQKYLINNNLNPMLANAYNTILCMLLLISGCEAYASPVLNKIGKSAIVKYFSDISLEIYCSTGIGFYLFISFITKLKLELSNIQNIFISSLFIIFVASILKLYTKKMKFLINNIGIKIYFLLVIILFVILMVIKGIVIL